MTVLNQTELSGLRSLTWWLYAGCRSDVPVVDAPLVVDHTLCQRVLVTLATDANTPAGQLLVAVDALQEDVGRGSCGCCTAGHTTITALETHVEFHRAS